jgi:N-acetylmuramoyl-L-alanine amidase
MIRKVLIRRLQRVFLILSIVLFAGIVYLAVTGVGYLRPRTIERLILITPTPERNAVALISGHTGFDSGAICGESNSPTLQEVEVVANIAELVRERLEAAGLEVLLLEEYDTRLTDLDTELLLSLHADSCIAASGFKATHPLNSAIPTTEKRLIACINTEYAAQTGLSLHANSITHDMTYYHAFRKVLPTTPTAILELGFLGGDGRLLTQEADRVAAGITESIFCFLQGTTTAQ